MASDDAERLRLPKQIEADPRGPALRGRLLEQQRLLWPGGAIRTPVVPLTQELCLALRAARLSRRLTRGLEDATRTLAAEEKGLRIADQKILQAGGGDRGQRVSRLLLLSDDGAERFYRQVESLLRRHGARVLAIRLEVSATDLGGAVLGADELARLLLLTHKEAVARALLALAPVVPDGADEANGAGPSSN
jgi:hypothetical protein